MSLINFFICLLPGKSADIWSLGITLYAFVFGDVPFKSQAIPVLYEQIKNEEISFPTNISISDDLKHLIMNMLNKDPEKRISMQIIKVRDEI
jgi:calcium/calmodulin-dependent protein kinase kinase 2